MKNELVANIEERKNGESIQILHYENGLFCSLLSYLMMSFNKTYLLQQRFSQPKDDSLSDCAMRGYAGISFIMLSHNPIFFFLAFMRNVLYPYIQIPSKISKGKNRGETVTLNELNI